MPRPKDVLRAFTGVIINASFRIRAFAATLIWPRPNKNLATRLLLKNLSAYTDIILTDTPIAYYHLDEASGFIAHDQSRNSNNGTLTTGITYGQTGADVHTSDTAMLFGANDTLSLPYT